VLLLQNYKCTSFETWSVGAGVKKVGGKDGWYVKAAADMLAAGRGEPRKALAEVVREALARCWADAGRAGWRSWRGGVLMEGWPKYEVGLANGALVVKFSSPNPDSIERETQRLREMGLEKGVHFTVKMPEGGGKGYVSILREGLAYAAWLSVYGSGR
jgi:Fe2+ transport system protein FeoA